MPRSAPAGMVDPASGARAPAPQGPLDPSTRGPAGRRVVGATPRSEAAWHRRRCLHHEGLRRQVLPGQQVTMSTEEPGSTRGDADHRVVRGLDYVEYVVRVERAPRPGLFVAGPWRWWALVSRDRSWWRTVDSSAVAYPVIRERYTDLDSARERADQLVVGIEDGAVTPPTRIAWRRGPARHRPPTPSS